MSTDIPSGNDSLNLAQKIARVMGAVSRVPKNGYNKFHDYYYATEGDVADTVREALAVEGIAIIPSTEKVDWRESGSGKGRIASVTVRYMITDGRDSFDAVFVGEGQDTGDKAIYKAYTGAHKYFLLRTFNISTGDDEDPEREEDAPPRAAPKRHEPTGKKEKPADKSLVGVFEKWQVAIDKTQTIGELRAAAPKELIDALPEPLRSRVKGYYLDHKKKIEARITQEIANESAERQAGEEG